MGEQRIRAQMAEEEAWLGGEEWRLICFSLSGGSSFLFFFFPMSGISGGQRAGAQLDGSGMRRYHADSSVVAVNAHV